MKRSNTEQNYSIKEMQSNKTENVAGMGGSDKCKLPSTTPITGLRRIQNLKMIIASLNFKTSSVVFIQ